MKTKLLLLHFLLPLFVFAQISQIGADIDGEAANDRSGTRRKLKCRWQYRSYWGSPERWKWI